MLILLLGWTIIVAVLYFVNRILDGAIVPPRLFLPIGGIILLLASYLIVSIMQYNRNIRSSHERIHRIEREIMDTLEQIRQHEANRTQASQPVAGTPKSYRRELETKSPKFIEKLREAVPGLTEGEENLCVLIKLNLKNKEIVHTLDIDSNTIYTFRSRLKRKLPLGENDTMDEWIRKLE